MASHQLCRSGPCSPRAWQSMSTTKPAGLVPATVTRRSRQATAEIGDETC